MSATAKSVLTLAAATLLLFGDVLFVPSAEILSHAGADLSSQYVHWRSFGFGELRSGNLPLWNPHIYGGAPYLGGFQSALLYPPNWIHLFLPLNLAVNWGIALHVFLLGWFAFLWARHRGVSHAGATLSGLLLTLGGAHQYHIFAGHLSNLCTMVWAPLLFLAIDGTVRDRSWRWPLLGAFAVAMQVFAGHPQYLFYTSVAASLYGALQLAFGAERLRPALGIAAMFAGGVLLSAAQLLPGLDAAGEAVRNQGTDFDFVATFSFPPENFLTLVAPSFFGNALEHPYWGRTYLWEVNVFVGAAGLVLALVGAWRGAREARRFAVTLGIATSVLALGAHTPLLELLYDFVPGFDKFRGSAKFMFQSSVFWTALAGIGFDVLRRDASLRKSAAGVAAGVALPLAAFATWIERNRGDGWIEWVDELRAAGRSAGEYYADRAFADPSFVADAAAGGARALWLATGACLLVGALLFVSRRREQALWALYGFAVLQVFVVARLARPTFDPAETRRQDPFAGLPLGEDERVLDPLEHNRGLSEGTLDAWGYDPGVARRYAEFMAATQGIHPDSASQYVSFRQYPAIYEMLRIRHALLRREAGFERYRAQQPMARLHPVHAAEVVPERDARLVALSRPEFDPRATVVVESAPPVALAPATGPERAEIVESSTDHFVAEVELTSPAYLLVTDAYSEGWRAWSSGEELEVVPANHAVMAVPLEAGEHRLRMEYRPTSWVLGAWTSALAWVAWFALGVRSLRRQK